MRKIFPGIVLLLMLTGCMSDRGGYYIPVGTLAGAAIGSGLGNSRGALIGAGIGALLDAGAYNGNYGGPVAYGGGYTTVSYPTYGYGGPVFYQQQGYVAPVVFSQSRSGNYHQRTMYRHVNGRHNNGYYQDNRARLRHNDRMRAKAHREKHQNR